MHVPGLKVAIPSDAHDAKGLLKTALRDSNPVMFIENVRLYAKKADVPEGDCLIPFGRARVLREGSDISIIAISGTVPDALGAAEDLEEAGISAEVIDPRTLNPLDIETLAASLRKTGRVIITHDGCKTGGVGAEIGQCLLENAFDYLNAPIVRVAGLDVPVPSSDLHHAVVPTPHRLVEEALKLAGKAA